jgi:ATP-dependent RNA helicase DDX18/HAS1
VPLNEYEFPASKLANVQAQLERLVSKNYYLHQVTQSDQVCSPSTVVWQ